VFKERALLIKNPCASLPLATYSSRGTITKFTKLLPLEPSEYHLGVGVGMKAPPEPYYDYAKDD